MNEPLDRPLARPFAARELEARIQKSFSQERKNLIDEAERVYWNETQCKIKRGQNLELGELIDQAVRDWLEKQTASNNSKKKVEP